MANTTAWSFILDGGTLSEIDGVIGSGVSIASEGVLQCLKSAGSACIGVMKPKSATGADTTYNMPLYYGFYVTCVAEGDADGLFFNDTSTGVYFEWLRASNVIRMHHTTAGVYVDSGSLNVGQKYKVDVYIYVSQASPPQTTAVFYLDEVIQGSAVYSSSATGVGELYAGGPDGGGGMADNANFQFGGVYITDGARWGPFTAARCVPVANSATYDAWTASAGDKWACVDEVPASDADYIYTSSAPDKQLFTHGGGAYAGAASILHTVVWCRAKAGTLTYPKRLARSSATDIVSAATTGASYAWQYPLHRDLDPATSAAWLEAAVTAYELGMTGYYGTNERDCSACQLVVFYPPPAAGGQIKKISGVDWANVKKYAGVAEASISKVSGVTAN